MPKVWLLSDPHFPGACNKQMDQYGDIWINHTDVILENVCKMCSEDDILLMPGDISNGLRYTDAKQDLEILGKFPCKVILSQGNHDNWTFKREPDAVRELLPENVIWVHERCFRVGNLAVVAAQGCEFKGVYPWPGHVSAHGNLAKAQKLEIPRFDAALDLLPEDEGVVRIVMTHFPTIAWDGSNGFFTQKLKPHNVACSVYGHAHGMSETIPACDVTVDGTRYILGSSDWLKMVPLHICDYEIDPSVHAQLVDGDGNVTLV